MLTRIQIGLVAALGALVTLVSPASAIVNGTTASSSSWPWAVQVVAVQEGAVAELCGGVLVGPTRVVTAGHCVGGRAPGEIEVIANSQELLDSGADVTEVLEYELAPSFLSGSATDLAVLTLASPPSPATTIEVLAGSEAAEFPDPAPALVAGWGSTTDASGSLSSSLRQGEVILTGSCGATGLRCSSGGNEICAGDLGGPVVVELGADTVSGDPSPANGTWRLAAIPVFGDVSCDESFYADLTEPGLRAFVGALRTLAVSIGGTGSGSVTANGIHCPGDCGESYAEGTAVSLTAGPAPGSTFTGWSEGGCAGGGPCTVTMDTDYAVVATFDLSASSPSPPSSPPPSSAPPPRTKLLEAKIDVRNGSATFKFRGRGGVSGFQCALSRRHRKARFRSCRSPKTYRHLAPGVYAFEVRAVGPGGADASPARKRFSIASA